MPLSQPVVLDYTLEDLYLQDDGDPNIALFFALPTSHSQGLASDPSLRKYIYQMPVAADEEAVARRRLHQILLKFSFTAGKLPLLLKDFNDNDLVDDALEVFKQLHVNQRPRLEIFPTLEDIKLAPDAKIVSTCPMDRVAHFPHLVNLDVHYDLLSKRGLTYSGLPIPKSTVIDTVIGSNGQDYVRDHPERLENEVQRMIRPIHEHALPFVAKLPQADGGMGTFIIRTEDQRHFAEGVLQDELRTMLQNLSPLNNHLHPCCLVLQERIPGESGALSLFVTQKGRPIWIAGGLQSFDEDNVFLGGVISYLDQPRLQEKYGAIVSQTAKYLHSRGYYGPCGADVMTDPTTGRHMVIDLNVRATSSYILGCLKSHFYERRGLTDALIQTIVGHHSLREFQEHFQKEICDGSLIVCAWAPRFTDDSSLTTIVMAAPGKQQLSELLAKVQAFMSAKDM